MNEEKATVEGLWGSMKERLAQTPAGWYKGFGPNSEQATSRGPSPEFLDKLETVVLGVFEKAPVRWHACSGVHGGVDMSWKRDPSRFDLSWDEETDEVFLCSYKADGVDNEIVFKHVSTQDTIDKIRSFLLEERRRSFLAYNDMAWRSGLTFHYVMEYNNKISFTQDASYLHYSLLGELNDALIEPSEDGEAKIWKQRLRYSSIQFDAMDIINQWRRRFEEVHGEGTYPVREGIESNKTWEVLQGYIDRAIIQFAMENPLLYPKRIEEEKKLICSFRVERDEKGVYYTDPMVREALLKLDVAPDFYG